MANSQLASALRTLLVNGYAITGVDRISPTASIVSAEKRDRLGARARSTILFIGGSPAANVLEMLSTIASATGAQPLVVTNANVTGNPAMPPEKFYELLGGVIQSDRLMRDDLPDVLYAFGHNKGYIGFTGKPDELLEEYVKEGLQFLLESRAYRYGQDRLFESLPDGLVLARPPLNLYFDAKAYEKGFHPSADDIKRFAGYVNDFNTRYASLVGRLHCFLVVSGTFTANNDALEEKANEFYSLCSTKLCHITAKNFGIIINAVREHCGNRSAINWVKILSRLVIEPSAVMDEIDRIKKDKIVTD
jgi:hypothetical protein